MSHNININYKKWNDITISKYREIAKVCNSELSEAEKNIGVIAILADVDESEIWNLSMDELHSLQNATQWINTLSFNKDIKFKTIKIKDIKCDIETDLKKMTVAQYVDFQAYFSPKDITDNLGKVLSCFIIPRGKKYNEGYDLDEFVKDIEDNVSIVTANEICFFFLKQLVSSIKVMLTCLNWMRAGMKKSKQTEMLKEQINQMQAILSQFTTGCY